MNSRAEYLMPYAHAAAPPRRSPHARSLLPDPVAPAVTKRAASLAAGPGCVLELFDLNDHSSARITLTLPAEASPGQLKVSILSPLGACLIGLRRGEVGQVSFLGEKHRFLILGIHRPHRDSDTAARGPR